MKKASKEDEIKMVAPIVVDQIISIIMPFVLIVVVLALTETAVVKLLLRFL